MEQRPAVALLVLVPADERQYAKSPSRATRWSTKSSRPDAAASAADTGTRAVADRASGRATGRATADYAARVTSIFGVTVDLVPLFSS